MSTGCNCIVVEEKPGRWFYVLEDRDAPKCAWDWREHATAYGPFKTLEAADKHLSDHHANPGSSTVVRSSEFKRDSVMDKLLQEAPEQTRQIEQRSVGHWFGLPPGCVMRIGR
jgi:hypothetical protein